MCFSYFRLGLVLYNLKLQADLKYHVEGIVQRVSLFINFHSSVGLKFMGNKGDAGCYKLGPHGSLDVCLGHLAFHTSRY